MKKILPAIVSDIDGVLLRGTIPIKDVSKSIIRLQQDKIPLLLMTNGGGKTEKSKTQFLNKYLFNDQQILNYQDLIQCHTPFKDLDHYKNEYILLGGNGDLLEIAMDYGYKKAIHIKELHQLCPWLYGLNTDVKIQLKQNLLERFKMTEQQLREDIAIKAAMVWSDVDQFEITLQLFSDVLISQNGKIANFDIKRGQQQNTQLYFSNNDLIYPNSINIPRHAGGVFKIALETVFEQQYKRQINSKIYGKPSIEQYKFAEKLIQKQNSSIKNIYMIGDNLQSDIQGVNNMKLLNNNQYKWISILVKTGIYKTGDINNSDYVVNNFNEAINLIYEKENINHNF